MEAAASSTTGLRSVQRTRAAHPWLSGDDTCSFGRAAHEWHSTQPRKGGTIRTTPDHDRPRLTRYMDRSIRSRLAARVLLCWDEPFRVSIRRVHTCSVVCMTEHPKRKGTNAQQPVLKRAPHRVVPGARGSAVRRRATEAGWTDHMIVRRRARQRHEDVDDRAPDAGASIEAT